MFGWLWRQAEVPPPPPMLELRLPEPVLAKATLCGCEWSWPLAAVPEVTDAARACGLATVGGVVQFRIPDGTCELYWWNTDSEARRTGEPWGAYAARSAVKVAAWAQSLPVAELVADGLRWGEVAALRAAGADVSNYLCVVLYFEVEAGLP